VAGLDLDKPDVKDGILVRGKGQHTGNAHPADHRIRLRVVGDGVPGADKHLVPDRGNLAAVPRRGIRPVAGLRGLHDRCGEQRQRQCEGQEEGEEEGGHGQFPRVVGRMAGVSRRVVPNDSRSHQEAGTILCMKYVIVIPDGCADEPVAELGDLTPLQAAKIPNMDRVAEAGVVGLPNNVPPSLPPASDVATLSLFGYDPLKYYPGRAPLETAAMGIHLGPNDWAVRCNLVHVPDGTMKDFTAGHISSE